MIHKANRVARTTDPQGRSWSTTSRWKRLLKGSTTVTERPVQSVRVTIVLVSHATSRTAKSSDDVPSEQVFSGHIAVNNPPRLRLTLEIKEPKKE
ncbi:hypothetical protein GCK32_009690 [Trichostrongylus colubriformis]|uniref:Uncharacterized protein n=1 Tax=Trichostrongylus colubriformis TaxID=6319 RepID=A0AAN8F1B4_TRICO